MGRVVIGYPIRSDEITLSGGSWYGNLPVTNAGNRQMGNYALSTTATAQIRADLGQARSIQVVAQAARNLEPGATWRVRGYTGGWGSGLVYDSGSVELVPSGRRVTDAWNLDFGGAVAFDAVSARYWQADYDNGTSECKIARFGVCEGWQPAINLEWGAQLSLETASRRTITDGGAAHYLKRPVRRVLTFSLRELTEAEALDLWDIYRLVGTAQQVVAVYDQDDTTTRRDSFFGVLRQPGSIETLVASRYGAPVVIEEEL